MAVSATVTPGTLLSEGEAITISKLNALGTPTVDISGAVGSLSIANNSIANIHVQSGAAIQFSKLESLTTGQLIVGNAGTPTAATLSGDATISSSGALTIASSSIETAMIADSTGASDGVTTAKLATGAVTGPKIEMGSDAQGDVLYHNGTSYVRLAAGTSGQFLSSGGAGANPSWIDAPPTISTTVYRADTTWTRPSGVSLIHVMVFGGGGGSTAEDPGGFGGIISDYIDVSGTLGGDGLEDDEIAIVVGAAGTAGQGVGGLTGGFNGGGGGDTTFGGPSSAYYLKGSGGTGGTSPGGDPGAAGEGTSTSYTAITHTAPNWAAVGIDEELGDFGLISTAFYGAGGDDPSGSGNSQPGNVGVAGAVVIRIIG